MNKIIIGYSFEIVIAVWLIALTFLQFKSSPKFSANSEGQNIAYVHGDSLHSGMNLIAKLERTLKESQSLSSLLMQMQQLSRMYTVIHCAVEWI